MSDQFLISECCKAAVYDDDAGTFYCKKCNCACDVQPIDMDDDFDDLDIITIDDEFDDY